MAVERDEYEFITRFRVEALAAAAQAEEALRGLGGAADQTTDQMDDLDQMMEQAKAAAVGLATFVTSALASFQIIKGSLQEFAGFEVAMLGIAKVTDLTAAELDAMGHSFENLAYTAGLPIENFLKVGEIAGSMGINGAKNIEEFTRAMVDLGGATNVTAEDGAAAIAMMLNVTKEGADQARTIASIVTQMGNMSAATESAILDRAQQIALATAAFGTSTTEAIALGTAMAELGLRAETSGTAIGSIFIAMSTAAVTGGKDLETFARATGLTVKGFKDMQENDPTGLFYRLLEQLSDKSQNEIVKTLSDMNILNAENAKTIIPLITGYERLSEVRKEAYTEQADPQALDREATVAVEALARQWAGLMEGLRTEVRQLGELLAPIALAFIDIGKAALDAFNGLPDLVQNTILLLGVLGPTFLAASLAVKGLGLAMTLLIPIGVRTAAMGGATAAAIAGMGTAGQVAGAGLAVARYAIGALLGPIGIAIAVAGTLAYALSDSGTSAEDMGTTLAQASTVMDQFAEATKRAHEEQIGLRNGITEATAAALAQSRAEMQRMKDSLSLQLAGTLNVEIDGQFADKVSGEMTGAMEALEELARNFPDVAQYANVNGMIDDLKNGKITFDEFRDKFNALIGTGAEAIKLVSDYRNAFDSGNTSAIAKATKDMVEYAKSTGLYADELDFIRKMAQAGDTEAVMLALSDLAREIELGSEAAAKLRETISPALMEAITDAANAEVAIAAYNEALNGNVEAARLILETGNPHAANEQGAKDAKDAVDALNESMRNLPTQDEITAYQEYGRSRAGSDRATYAMGESAAAKEGILTLIRYAEGTLGPNTRGYNETLDRGRYTGGDVNLINMTLREVLELQKAMLADPRNAATHGDPSSAVGAYQIVGTTLGGRGLDGQGGLIQTLNLSMDELFTPELQDRLAMELLRGRQGQGLEGLRNEWEGLKRTDDNNINTALSGSVIPRLDPEVERAQTKAAEDAKRAFEDEANARADLLTAQEDSIAAAELELSLIGKSVSEQARLRTEFDLLNQAKRDGINVDTERTASGRTYREEIEATARAMGELAAQEEKQQKSAERAAKATEFYNEQQEAFQQGVLDAIMEGDSLISVLGGIAKAFARAALEAALFGSGPFGSGGGILTNVFGSLFGGLFGGAAKVVASAKGNVFSVQGSGEAAHVTAFARGGLPGLSDYENEIVRNPTMFAMGEDRVGLMGEAGDEAVMPLQQGKVRAIMDGVEVLLPLTRAADGSLGVTVPEELQQPKPYALGGVPDGVEPGWRDVAMSAGGGSRGDTGTFAPGAVNLDYHPTYILNIEDGKATVSGGSDSKSQGTDRDKLLESLDGVMRAKMIEFLTNEMRNGGMLNPAAKPYG